MDVFWRTTEWFRKLPADLILITYFLLPPFQLKEFDINCHFANITVHQMTFISFIPSLPGIQSLHWTSSSLRILLFTALSSGSSTAPCLLFHPATDGGERIHRVNPQPSHLTPIGSSNISQRSDYDRRFSRGWMPPHWSGSGSIGASFSKANGDRWLVQFTHWPKRPALYSAAAIAARREILPMVAR